MNDQPKSSSSGGVLTLIERTLRYAVPSVAALHVLVFLYVSFSRINYPFELEWMEGGSLDHVLRLLDGKPLYVEPSFEFTPYIYTPLYFWISALFAKIFGASFVVMRAVSLVSTLACAAIMYGLARSWGCRKLNAGVAACIFLALFKISGGWYDLARVDMLFLAFMFGSFLACRRAENWQGYIATAILAFLAFATKQSAIAGAGAVLVILIARDRRMGLVAATIFAALTGIFCIALNLTSDGWFWYYAFTLPSENPTNAPNWRAILYWEFYVSLRIGALIVLAELPFALRERTNRREAIEFLVFFLAMTITAWMTRFHRGGYANALIPFYMVMGLAMVRGWERFGCGGGESPGRLASRCAVHLIFILQFSALTYSPSHQIPSKADYRAGKEWVKRIQESEGDVLLVYSGYLARLAGKESPSPGLAYHVFIGSPEDKLDYMKKIADGIRSRKYKTVITAEKWLYSENFRGFITQLYDMDPMPPPGEDSFYPVTGGEVRPEIIYRLKKDLPPFPELPPNASVVPAPQAHHDHDHHEHDHHDHIHE